MFNDQLPWFNKYVYLIIKNVLIGIKMIPNQMITFVNKKHNDFSRKLIRGVFTV